LTYVRPHLNSFTPTKRIMTLCIYTYKITFEEVPYYYYGVRKQKKENEEYFGTPVTHKWMWEFYTPKKQILEIFDYSNEGWIKAQEVEKRLINPFYNNDPYCLNENVGGFVSLEALSKLGKKLYETKSGMFSRTKEKLREDCSKAGKITGNKHYKNGTGLFSLTEEQKLENCKKGGKIQGLKSKELGIGIFSLTKEEQREIGRKYGKIGGAVVAEKYSKSFTLVSPTGEIITGKNLTKFCRDNNLTRSNIQKVMNGQRSQHKGWRSV